MDRRGNWDAYQEYVPNTQWDWTYSETRTHTGANGIDTRHRDFDGPNDDNGGPNNPVAVEMEQDARGNLVDDEAHRYEYDEENRLTRVCRIDDQTCGGAAGEVEIEYDVLGRVIRRTTQPGGQDERTFRYVYDGLSYAAIQEWEDGIGSGGAPGLLRAFVYAGSHIEPVTMIDYTDAGAETAGTAEPFHYLRDERNCVIALLDETGFIAESYRYDPYGRTYVWSGEADGPPDRVWSADTWLTAYPPPPNPLSPSFVGNPFGFTGHRFSAAGLFETPFRAYSPDLGRWLQRDPLGHIDGTNLYNYLRENPCGWLDPLGLFRWPWESKEKEPERNKLEIPEKYRKEKNESQQDVDDAIDALEAKKKANQEALNAGSQVAEDALGAAARLNPLTDAVEAVTGKDGVTGEDLTTAERLQSLAGIVPLGKLADAAGDVADAARLGARVNKLGPDELAGGAHSVFKTGADGAITGYTTFDEHGRPIRRYRAQGKPLVV